MISKFSVQGWRMGWNTASFAIKKCNDEKRDACIDGMGAGMKCVRISSLSPLALVKSFF